MLLLIQMDINIWKIKREVFGDKVGSKTRPCDKLPLLVARINVNLVRKHEEACK